MNNEEGQTHPSICGSTAPSGPWPPSQDVSIHPYFQLFSSILSSSFSLQAYRRLFVKPVRGISEVSWTQILFRGGVVTPTLNPQPGAPGCPFLTCPAWVTLPVATPPPA